MFKGILYLLVTTLTCQFFVANAQTASEVPDFTPSLRLDSLPKQWKEITRGMNAREGIVEYIPPEQDAKHWTELICIQSLDVRNGKIRSIKEVIRRIENTTLNSYPRDKVSFQVLKMGKADAVYEWVLHDDQGDVPKQHDIARVFFNKGNVYRIGFTKKHEPMTHIERDKWFAVLQDSVSIVPFEQALWRTENELSFASRLQDRLDLGRWKDWKLNRTLETAEGCANKVYISPDFNGSYFNECLEIVSMPNCKVDTIQALFDVEKESIRRIGGKSVKIEVLSEAPTEIIYFYHHPKDHLQRNAIVKSFMVGKDYFSITHFSGSDNKATDEQIQEWKSWLKQIKVTNS